MRSIKEQYRCFLNTPVGAHIYKRFKQILYTSEDSLVEVLKNTALQDFSPPHCERLSVCDIGGGDGNRIVRILHFLHRRFDVGFRLDFVEQSRPFISEFDATSLKSYTQIKLVHGLFEEVALSGNYDVIFLIHSIFAFENEDALKKVLSLLRAGGRIIIVSNSTNSFLAGLKSLVDQGYDDNRFEIDRVCNHLDSRNVSYRRFSFRTTWTLSDANYQQDLKTILDWMSLGRFESFSGEQIEKVFEYIKKHTIRSSGRAIFSEEETVLVI
jgi:SAM-dependent methyltransferase